MPERFEIYIVYKRRYIITLPFLSFPFNAFAHDQCSNSRCTTVSVGVSKLVYACLIFVDATVKVCGSTIVTCCCHNSCCVFSSSLNQTAHGGRQMSFDR